MRSLHATTAIIVPLALIIAGACSPDVSVMTPAKLQTGYWHARITLPGGDIETGIEINRNGEEYRATLINGQERVRIDEVRFSNDQLVLRFPAFDNEINARLEGGKLIGALKLVKRHGRVQLMPFVAVPGAPRVDKNNSAAATVDMSGRWAVEFHDEDGTSVPSVGEFAQRGSRLFGTFLNPTADHRYLSGYVRSNSFYLAAFDGAHAFFFAGSVDKDSITDAKFWSGTEFQQTWSAVRNPDAVLPDAYKLTYLKPGFDRLDFEFSNLEGQPVSLADPKFHGKVVIVTITGTWCPNCHDEAGFIVPLYKEYHEQGLEVIALMYEHSEDTALAIGQIRKFRQKFGIQFETLIAGISDTDEVSRTLPALSSVSAFPTTIFIDRSGAVRVIHTGFSGPATGKHHERLKKELTSLVAQLIGEPPDIQVPPAPDGQIS